MAAQDGFETLAIHAGQEPDPLTGAVVPPIYQVSTYKQDGVGGLRPRPRVLALGQPDAHRAGGMPDRARGRGQGAGLRLRHGRRRLPAPHRLLARRSRPHPRRRLRRTFRLFAKVYERWGVSHQPVRIRRPGRGAGRAGRAPGPGDLGRDADQPAARHRGHRRAGRPGPRRRRPARRGQHVRLAVPAAADPAGRRRGGAFHDQVPGRALRRGGRRGRDRRRRARRAARLPPERDGRGGGRVRRLAHAARDQDAGGADGPALRERRPGRRDARRAPGGQPGVLPGSSVAPRSRGGGQADARLRRDGVVPGPRRRRGGGRACARGPGCSRWPSRSAGWSR